MNLIEHLRRQFEWAEKTFGPATINRVPGVLAHIKKEIKEVEAKPRDLTEWIDIAILSFDGARQAGYTPEEVAAALFAKQLKNELREWPDWRKVPEGQVIEHIRELDVLVREEQEDWP